MTINFASRKVRVSELKQGECFKINNYSVYMVTNTMATETLTGVKCVNLLTGSLVDFSVEYPVERVDAEITVK